MCVCGGGGASHQRILAFAVWPLRHQFKGAGPLDSIKMDFGLLGCRFEEFRQRLLKNVIRNKSVQAYRAVAKCHSVEHGADISTDL